MLLWAVQFCDSSRLLTRASSYAALHFKLAAGSQEDAQSYNDVPFTYMPQLDASRDADIIDLLPDYLTDEITFPRPHVAKFYARVSRSLAERADTSIL